MTTARDNVQHSTAMSSPTGPGESARIDALGEARRAEAAGDLWAAIDAYSRANRIAADAATERRLRDLRHLAAQTIRPAARADWPPTLADPFPDEDGLPEADLADVDAAIIGGAILHHGALLVRGFADDRASDELRTAVDRALESPRPPAPGDEWYDEFVPDPDDQALSVGRAMTGRLGGGMLAVDAPRAFFLFCELVARVGFVQHVAEYFGERPVLSADKTTFRRMREAVRPAWHQDGSFMGDVRAVNLWLSLSHCGGASDTIGLDVIPRRLDEFLATGTDDAPAEVVAIGQRLIDRTVAASMITPEFRPGDALCFDDRFLHRTSETQPGGVRHAIEAWFFAPSHFPGQYGALAI